MAVTLTMEWKTGPVQGHFEVRHGRFLNGRLEKGKGRFTRNGFSCPGEGPVRIRFVIDQENVSVGAFATAVSVRTATNPFTFFLRDVQPDQPVYIPAYGVAVTTENDRRSYPAIADAVHRRNLRSVLQTLDAEPEESFENAARHTREMCVPTWLGISRDSRVFELSYAREGLSENSITPHWRPNCVTPQELDGKLPVFRFAVGRGIGCTRTTTYRLDSGVLPILHTLITDDDIRYECTAFASLEQKHLRPAKVRGTDYLYAAGRLAGCTFTPEQRVAFDQTVPVEENTGEEVVLYFRARAINTGTVPRYAFFKTLTFNQVASTKIAYEGDSGFSRYNSGRVFCVSRMNQHPLPQEEMAVLLQPGTASELEFFVPHTPISLARARKLARQDFTRRLAECRRFWMAKLATGTRYNLPEPRINDMVKAGLLHLDLTLYGLEPDGTLTPTVGVYGPIGSESAPIIQFIDSMGRHQLAERCLQFFLDQQRENGFMQNFTTYMLETGAALWSMGEHYRYTGDEPWLRRIMPNLLKACEYLIEWRRRNLREDLRGKGYGLMDGKVADPEDPYHIFMLNGYSCLGMMRVAEMLGKINPRQARRIHAEAQALLKDIRGAFFDALANGPVVPLGDGTWIPTAAPWVEYPGPVCLMAEGGSWYSHGTFTARDAMVGPLYLVLQEVIAPGEPAVDFLMNFQSELMCTRNTAFSQPYYSPHPRIHLKRNEVKPFLKAYYNTVSSLADRQTYVFWEHFFHASPHKTHEEAWFLMQTRWMLYMEEGDTLKLLPGIPRRWLENGQRIEIVNAVSYFGPFSLTVVASSDGEQMEAKITFPSKRGPASVELRLPHPHHQKPSTVTGGIYDQETETVRITPFRGRATVHLSFLST